MKTRTFWWIERAAVVAVALISTTQALEAQTVVWARKAFGQSHASPCGGTFNWPNNNASGQDQLISTDCNKSYVAEPSNWSTTSYPDGAGVNVILGSGGAPGTSLGGLQITLNSLTIQNVGALNITFGSSLAANSFVFKGDGVLTNEGGGGPDPIITVKSSGSMRKTGGVDSYLIAPNVMLNSTNATISSLSGSLVLPGNSSTHTNPIFTANADASVILAPSGHSTYLTGKVKGTGAGKIRHNGGNLVVGAGGAQFNFPDALFQWSGGAIQTIAADRPLVNTGTINLTGAGSIFGLFFSNSGSMVESGAGSLNIPFGSQFENGTAGVYDLKNNNGITGLGGGGPNPAFNNKGLLRKSGGSGISDLRTDDSLYFNHLGDTVQVDTGTIRFGKGQSTGANFVIAAGAKADLTGGSFATNFEGNYTGSGAGAVELASGQINLTGTGATFNFPPNLFQWVGGGIGGQASSPFINAGTMTLNGSAGKQFTGAINNGLIIQNGSGMRNIPFGSQFRNGATGLIDLRTDAEISATGGGGPNPTLENEGRITKSGGTGVTIFGQDLFVTNRGTIEVLTGTIQSRLYTQESGTTSMDGGNLNFVNEAVFNGGSLVGRGTITGSVKNNGATLSPGHSPGKLTVDGNYTQGENGSLNIELGGNTAGSQYDQLVVNGTATLGGTLNITLINGYRPALGDVFTIVSPQSFSGEFAHINAEGLSVQANYASGAITVTVTSVPNLLLNISTRLNVLTGNDALIGGFIIVGSEPKKVIIRGLGPSTGVSGALQNPTLELFDANGPVAMNDNWKENQRAAIEASGIAPTDNAEAAIVRTLPVGPYTAVLRGNKNSTGIGLLEAYDLDQHAKSKLANISARGFVDTGDNALIGGFIASGFGGGSDTKVVVRALGPSLAEQNISNFLPDPTLKLIDGNGSTVRANDNWKESQKAALEALGIQPHKDAESSLIATLPAGNYTAVVTDKNNGKGIAIVEVYNID